MNSLAAVLAADSATTVQYYGSRGIEQRYFKGANKIFQLSNHHPVGLMIYNSAGLLSVPWEVIIKEFRKSLSTKSFNTVEGFADEFFDFIQSNSRFFPDEIRREKFCDFASSTGLSALLSIKSALKDAGESDPSQHIQRYCGEVNVSDELPYSDDEASELAKACWDEVFQQLTKYVELVELAIDPKDLESFTKAVFVQSLSNHGNDDNYTGMVFAGFGDHSIFPELVHYRRCEFWGVKFSARSKETQSVNHNRPAIIRGFAQTSMVDTFTSGISFDAFAKLNSFVAEELLNLVDSFNDDHNLSIDVDAAIKTAIDNFNEKLFGYMRTDHDDPLRRVIGFLPVDEMAELAETLINLQSLKEKVTKPSETVGGPVDVAAITRAEGLVWIRRKHYFDAGINSRYFTRQ